MIKQDDEKDVKVEASAEKMEERKEQHAAERMMDAGVGVTAAKLAKMEWKWRTMLLKILN